MENESNSLPIQIHCQIVTPHGLIARRVVESALSNYLRALEVATYQYFADRKLWTSVLVAHCLLAAKERPAIEVQQYLVDPVTEDWKTEIGERLNQVPAPQIESGAICFWMMITVEDGLKCAEEGMITYEPPFSTLSERDKPTTLDFAYAEGAETPKIEFERFYENVIPEPGFLDRIMGFFFETTAIPDYRERANPNVAIGFPDIEEDTLEAWNRAVEAGTSPKESWFGRGDFHLRNGEFEAAVKDFTIAIEKWPEDARLYLARSISVESVSLESALQDLDKAIALSPDFSAARFHRSRLLMELGAKDEAAKELESCFSIRPIFPDHLIFGVCQAIEFDSNADIDDKLELLKKLDPHCPDRCALENYLNRIRGDYKFSDLDISRLEEGLIHSPYNIRLRFELIYTLEVLQRFQEVRDQSGRLLKFFPGNLELHQLIAHANFQLSDYDQALECVEAGLEVMPSCPDLNCIKGHSLFCQGEIEAATVCIEKVLDEVPEHYRALWVLGHIHFDNQDYQSAEELFRKCNQMIHDPYTTRMLAVCVANLGQLKEAASLISSCIENYAESYELKHLYAMLLQDLKNSNDALTQINSAIRLKPGSAEMHFLKANILLSLTMRDEALIELNRAIELSPDYAQAIELRANVHSTNNDYSLAEADYNTLVEQFPDNTYPLMLRAQFWQHSGDLDKAQLDLDSAKDLDPEIAFDAVMQQKYREAQTLFQNEEYERVIELCDEIDNTVDASFWTLRLRAVALWYDEQHVEAAEAYTHCLDMLNQNAESQGSSDWFSVLSSRGQVYAEMGEYQLALADLDQVIDDKEGEIGPVARAYAQSGRGLAMSGLNRFDEALADFRAAISVTPDNAWLHFNQALFHLQRNEKEKARFCLDLSMQCNNPKLTRRKLNKAKGFLASLD